MYRRNHILRQTGLLVFGECSRKGKRRFLRDSKPSTLISHGVAISQIPGPSPRFALSPSFFAFSLSSAALFFPLSRIAIYSYLVTYVRTYIYYVAARVSFLFSVPTTLSLSLSASDEPRVGFSKRCLLSLTSKLAVRLLADPSIFEERR